MNEFTEIKKEVTQHRNPMESVQIGAVQIPKHGAIIEIMKI